MPKRPWLPPTTVPPVGLGAISKMAFGAAYPDVGPPGRVSKLAQRGMFGVNILVDPRAVKGLKAYAILNDMQARDLAPVINDWIRQLATKLGQVITRQIDRDQLTFTGQTKSACGWIPEGGGQTIGGMQIQHVRVGIFPEMAEAEETAQYRHPISYLAPLISGSSPAPAPSVGRGAGTPFGRPLVEQRILFWAVTKLGIDPNTPEGRKRFYKVLGKIMRRGTIPHDFLSAAGNSDEWRGTITGAQESLNSSVKELLSPPTDAEFELGATALAYARKTRARARTEASMQPFEPPPAETVASYNQVWASGFMRAVTKKIGRKTVRSWK